uniref:Uncharacterized protein n=1 Tax=Panagrolaimus sp. ES5 TaxID=591445 RepID=A0AC34FRC9_9BILA
MKKFGKTLRLVFNDNENNAAGAVNDNHETIPLKDAQHFSGGGPFDPSGRTTTTSGGTTPGTIGPSEINFNPAVNNASTKLRKHQLLSIRSGDNDNSGFRYRKARNKIGGNEKDHWKEENLIHMRAFENDVGKVKELCEQHGNDLFQPIKRHANQDDKKALKYQQPPVYFAALGSSLDTSKFLINNGFAKDVREVPKSWDRTFGSRAPSYNLLKPLHLIALYGGQPSHQRATQNVDELAEVFLNATESDGFPDIVDSFNTTPLHYACMSGNFDLVKKLIGLKANVNAQQDITLMTPLHFACQYEEEEIIKFLLRNGSNANLTDENGNTPLHFVVRCSDNVEIVKAIIKAIEKDKKEAFICVKNSNGIDAMRLAVEHNRLEIAEFLLKFHVSTHSHHSHETLLVHLAAQKKSPDMVSKLINYGWTTEERDYRGQTPLHFAAEEDNILLVKSLLFKNANLEARDEKGYTPLLAAASRDSVEVVKLLHELALITALSFYGETILGVATKHNSTKVVKVS